MREKLRWALHLLSLRVKTSVRYAVAIGLLALAAGVLLTPSTDPAHCHGARRPAAGTPGPEESNPPPTPSLPPGTVGVAVQLAEPATVSAVRPGYRVDLVTRASDPAEPIAGTAAGPPDVPLLARNALVMSVTAPDDGVIFLALPPQQAHRVSRVAPGVGIGLIVRSG